MCSSDLWGPGEGTEITNEKLTEALKEFADDEKNRATTKEFRKDDMAAFEAADLRANSYIKVGDTYLQPAAEEIKSAWSEWEKGENGSKATRVAQMTGALVSGSDFRGASMSGVNMGCVNGRFVKMASTLLHAAHFRLATLPNTDFRCATLPKADFQ